VVTGCYATRRPGEVADLPNVAEVVPNDDKPRLIQVLGSASAFTTTAERFGDGEGACGAAIEPGMAGRTAFTLRVQTGCAEPCTYCIIPSTRGRPRSVPVEDVLGQVRRVAASGFREIALTGVHLGSYGRDLTPASSLYGLLRALAAISNVDDGDARVRFRISSLEPMDCSREVVALVADHACLASHFHLPLQHASNRVLDAMRRPYTLAQYAELVDGIRARIPDASIGSDIIVGFPGETDEDFRQLASYLEGSPLTHVHVFPYSDRSGTAASAMTGKVPGTTVRERARHLRGISEQLAARFHASQIGTVQQGLTLEDGCLAVTSNYLKVRIAPGRVRNEWVDVRITGTEGPALTGEIE
jgi:threonylcarbamoyladenosine tRNA methylthiotransferase MtaB